LFDAWAKHYKLGKAELIRTDISNFDTNKAVDGDPMKSWIDTFEKNEESIKINGWAYLEKQNALFADIDVVLISGNEAYEIPTKRLLRNDITKSINWRYNVDNCGFDASANLNLLPP